MESPEDEFVRAEVKGVEIYRCSEYEWILITLILDIRGRWPKIIAGDFHACTLECRSRTANVRLRVHLGAFAELDVVLSNVRTEYTFKGNDRGDLTYVNAALTKSILKQTPWQSAWISRVNRTRTKARRMSDGLPRWTAKGTKKYYW